MRGKAVAEAHRTKDDSEGGIPVVAGDYAIKSKGSSGDESAAIKWDAGLGYEGFEE